MQSVIIVIMVIAFISAVLISLIVSTLSSITVIPLLTNKIIKDARDDPSLVRLYRTNVIPEIKGYHDILTANVKKVSDNKLLLSIELAGDANRNEKYETVYIWVIYYTNSISGKD